MPHFNQDEVTDRFIRYASVFTQSKDGIPDTPSTSCQFDLARLLAKELKEMGASGVFLDEEKCYVYATIPGNIPACAEQLAGRPDARAKGRENNAPIIALVAHMDTTSDVDASGHPSIHPRRIDHYDGGRIVLNEETGISMGPEEYPRLKQLAGKTLVVTDGTSVLGGDDKAGVTQIMEAASFLLRHPEIAHGTVRIMFTPDEEVGNGTLNADMDRLAADYAYTVDGNAVGTLEYECFNAASAVVSVKGYSTHPGAAKGRMKNALLMSMEYNALLPQDEIPARTEGYEGFYHLTDLNGTSDLARMEYILRDHDRASFERRKKTMLDAAGVMNARYGAGSFDVELRESYRNMAEKVRPHMHLVTNALEAIREVGLEPVTSPIRGGTDGAVLSWMGLPCPNLGTGAYNIHSRYEYVVAQEMVLGAEILLRILNKYAAFELDPIS